MIGYCEIILVYVFIIKGEATGMGLIFAAKALARIEQQKDDAMQTYFLAGTLVKFTYAVLWSLFFKYNEVFGTELVKNIFISTGLIG
ncbi:MAG: hypothetical protein IPM34_04440 [Saprospiraceae bacterium]|nr:hypothetical protein [Saprospiraceae bacterium]